MIISRSIQCCCKWHCVLIFYGWVVFHFVWISHLLHPFISGWAFRLRPWEECLTSLVHFSCPSRKRPVFTLHSSLFTGTLTPSSQSSCPLALLKEKTGQSKWIYLQRLWKLSSKFSKSIPEFWLSYSCVKKPRFSHLRIESLSWVNRKDISDEKLKKSFFHIKPFPNLWPPEREVYFWFMWTLMYIYSHTNTYSHAYIICVYVCVCVCTFIYILYCLRKSWFDTVLLFDLNMLPSFYVFNYKTCVYETKKDGKYLLNCLVSGKFSINEWYLLWYVLCFIKFIQ